MMLSSIGSFSTITWYNYIDEWVFWCHNVTALTVQIKVHSLRSDIHATFNRTSPSLVSDSHPLRNLTFLGKIQRTNHTSMQAAWATQTQFCPLGTHHCWLGRCSMEQKVCLTLLHSGNWTPYLLISSNAISTWPNAIITTALPTWCIVLRV